MAHQGGGGRLIQMIGFHPMHGMLGEFVGVFEIHFDFDMGPVGFNRFGADVEFLRDVAGAPSLADQLKRLQFAVAEGSLG